MCSLSDKKSVMDFLGTPAKLTNSVTFVISPWQATQKQPQVSYQLDKNRKKSESFDDIFGAGMTLKYDPRRPN